MIEIRDDLNYGPEFASRDFYINRQIVSLIKERKILDVTITSQQRAYVLTIIYEDEEYSVQKAQYTILSKNVKQKTDIKNSYISLTNNGIIYYTPYTNTSE